MDDVEERRESKAGQMLPGIAGICMFMIFMTMINVYAGLHGAFGAGVTKYGILTLCSLLAVGIFGLLRLKKWGWSMVTAGCLLLAAGDFVGEESLAGVLGPRIASATAITACVALKIERAAMIRVMHEEHAFSDMFLKFLLARSIRTQADLIDQLFNSSEKRLLRILLLMAEFGAAGEPETLIPQITQETLAEMIGTTRSRVSFFMNRFRKLGFIDYNGRIRVHKSLLNVVLHD